MSLPPYGFEQGAKYTRDDISSFIGKPLVRGGGWYTGHDEFKGDFFVFANIENAGRTGVDHDNKFIGDDLQGHAKPSTSLGQPQVKQLLDPAVRKYIFCR